MSKIIFNGHQHRQIETNPNVASVSDRAIQYTANFKMKAVQENIQGKGPAQIFREAGSDLETIGLKKAQSAIKRWKETYICLLKIILKTYLKNFQVRFEISGKTLNLLNTLF